MDRGQMVEKVADMIHGIVGEAQGDSWTLYEFAPSSQQEVSRADARRVLDAVLPQVSTVAELEALDGCAFLASAGVHPRKAVRLASAWKGYNFGQFGPLTIVWQP